MLCMLSLQLLKGQGLDASIYFYKILATVINYYKLYVATAIYVSTH